MPNALPAFDLSTERPVGPPMLCRTGSLTEIPDDPNLLASWKEDGWRAMCAMTDTDGVLRSRGGHHITQVPYITGHLSALGLPAGTVLDGEIVDRVRPRQLRRTGTILEANRPHVPNGEDPALTYAIFDALFIGGEDLRDRPLHERLARLGDLLTTLLPASDLDAAEMAVLLEHVPVTARFVQDALDRGKEGVVIKHRDSVYRHGGRADWCRYKPQETVDAVCTAVIRNERDEVTSLAFRLDSGATGQVASGLTEQDRRHIGTNLHTYVGRLLEIAHHGIERSGSLRHPVYHGVRHPDDKPAPRSRRRSGTIRATAAASAPSKGPGNTRNYRKMKDPKLLACRDSLRSGSGEAFQRCMETGSQNPAADLEIVLAEIARRGL